MRALWLMALALAACATATPTPEPLPVETLRPVPHGRLLYFPPSGTPTARQKELAARTPLPGVPDARAVVLRVADVGSGWTQRFDPTALNHRGAATASFEWGGGGDAAPNGLRIVQVVVQVFETAARAEDEQPKRWRALRTAFREGRLDYHEVPPPEVGDAAQAWRADWPGYDFRSYAVFARMGNALFEVSVGGPRATVEAASTVPLFAAMTSRLTR